MAQDFTNPFLEDDDDEVAPTSEPALPALPLELPAVASPREEEDWPVAEDQAPLPEQDWQPTPPPEDEPWDFSFDLEDEAGPISESVPVAAPIAEPRLEEPDLLDAVVDNSGGATDDWGFLDLDEPELALPVEASSEPEPVSLIESLDDEELGNLEEDWGFSFDNDEASVEVPLALPLPVEAPVPAPALEDGWGFSLDDKEDEDLAVPVGLPLPLTDDESETPAEDETDWGFFEAASEDEIPLEEWGFTDELSDTPPVAEDPEAGEFPEDDADALARFMDEVPEEEEPESEPVESQTEDKDEESASDGIGARVAAIWAQVRSELRGGVSTPPPARQNSEDEEESGGPGAAAGGILGKIFYPYTWLVGKILGLIILILSPLKRIPFLAPFIVGNLFFKIIAFALPLVVIFALLYWQGSKPLAVPGDLAFPDGGRAAISDFGYDSKTHEAYATVTNKGDVIAEVTPTLEVYSLKRGLNPLSFFFAKPNAKCEAKTVRVEIDSEVKVRVKCPIDGSAKKVTGELEW